jgi:hypothetical protein
MSKTDLTRAKATHVLANGVSNPPLVLREAK